MEHKEHDEDKKIKFLRARTKSDSKTHLHLNKALPISEGSISQYLSEPTLRKSHSALSLSLDFDNIALQPPRLNKKISGEPKICRNKLKYFNKDGSVETSISLTHSTYKKCKGLKGYKVNVYNSMGKKVCALTFHNKKDRDLWTVALHRASSVKIKEKTKSSDESESPLRGFSKPNYELIPLNIKESEYELVRNMTKESHKCKIIRIEKVLNPRMRKIYEQELDFVKQINHNNPNIDYVKLLFHGTSKTEPSKIYNGAKGFMVNFATEGALWGAGVYFADKSVYSDKYAYHQGKYKQMFLAEVITGDVFESATQNPTLKIPPAKLLDSDQTFTELHHDSVKGELDGVGIYVVYENCHAFPTYLITYEDTV